MHEAPCPRGREDEPCGDDDDEREARDEVDGDVEAFRADPSAMPETASAAQQMRLRKWTIWSE